MQTVNSLQSKTGIRRAVLKAPQIGAGNGKVIEKTLPGQSCLFRAVLGIVPFGGTDGIRTAARQKTSGKVFSKVLPIERNGGR